MERPILVYAGEGTGDPTRRGIEAFLADRGFPWERVVAAEVDGARLAQAAALYVPGGWAWPYVRDLGPDAKRAVRAFVRGGGCYVGVCAGSYLAADLIKWQGRFVEYDLDLFRGTAVGPVDVIQPWKSWRLTELELDPTAAVNAGERRQVALYWGGPVYRPHPAQPVSVLSRYAANGEAAAIAHAYGRGQVLLMGCHLELGWDDGAAVFDLAGGHGAQWDWLERALRWTLDQARTRGEERSATSVQGTGGSRGGEPLAGRDREGAGG